MEKTQPKKRLWVVLLLAVVVVLLLLAYYLWQNGSLAWRLPGLLGGSPSYQAIFLSNGQVYFGKASSINSQYITLRDVYYLQVSQNLQPPSGQQTQSLSLAKLGMTELHKPKDEMKINRDHVIFIEDLDEDSQVVQAIIRYKEGQE
jgi:hypothetical protein